MFMQYYLHVVLWHFFFFLEGLYDFFCKKNKKLKRKRQVFL